MLNTLQKIVRTLLGINVIEDEMLRLQEERLEKLSKLQGFELKILEGIMQDYCIEIIPHIMNGGVEEDVVEWTDYRGRLRKTGKERTERQQELHDALVEAATKHTQYTKRFITNSQFDTRIENLRFLEPVAVIKLINAQINDPALIQPLVERINACQVKG